MLILGQDRLAENEVWLRTRSMRARLAGGNGGFGKDS